MDLSYGTKQRNIVVEKLRTGDGVLYRGSSCVFVRINDRVAAKLYHHRWKRDKCHFIQRYAAGFRVAPLVGSKFHALSENGEYSMHGYLTQVVDTPFYEMYRRANGVEDAEEYKRLCRQVEDLFQTAKKQIVRKCSAIGLSSNDLHSDNIGRHKGSWVAIDFDLVYTIQPGRANLRQLKAPKGLRV